MSRVQRISTVLSQLMSRRGYASVVAAEQQMDAIRNVVGESLASQIRIGRLRSGSLEIIVADSVTMQELTFQERQIVRRLADMTPEITIKRLRMKVGQVSGEF
ncbi:MAG: DUF721 domain-containing protein [Planctomycetota bacterium]